MNESQRAINHIHWVGEGHRFLQRKLANLLRKKRLPITRQVLMVMTLELPLLVSLRQALNNLPPGNLQELFFSFHPWNTDQCRNPPDDEALLATATELANIVKGIDSLRDLRLVHATSSLTSLFLAACSWLECIHLKACPGSEAVIQGIFSINSLRTVTMEDINFESSEAINAFCHGIENSSVEVLRLLSVSFRPEHEHQVATALAHSNTLVHFDYQGGACPSFGVPYCVALSNNIDTKLERLGLNLFQESRRSMLDLNGDQGTVKGIDGLIENKIRNFLKWNVQRKICPSLFAAIDKQRTDAMRKQCLVKAFEAVDIPVAFEYMSTNQNNMIALIQRLGRSRKRPRED